jgi:hypothetical protein
VLLVLALALVRLGCKDRARSAGLVAEAKFGIFYGGQVQRREQIPFELDRAKQQHGIRIDFAERLERSVKVAWELDMPGSSRRIRDSRGRVGKGRLVKLEEATIPAGRQRFDRLLHFQPGDPLGTWNIRVLVEQEVVIDRPFLVYDAQARARAKQRDAGRPPP